MWDDSLQNSFFCAFSDCGQYNGFDKDGDYNWRDPAAAAAKSRVESSPLGAESVNGLCRSCNLNQELKIRQLAKFVPEDPRREDEEMERYRRHLERAYKLCRKCEAHLFQRLGEQSSWLKPKLLSFRIEKNRQTEQRSHQLVKAAAAKQKALGLALLGAHVVSVTCSIVALYEPSSPPRIRWGAVIF